MSTIFGITAPGEVMTVVDGTIVLDASFNAGGDTVVLAGQCRQVISAILSGSFVTIAGGGISISIPVGLAGLTVDFADGDRSLRYDTTAGQVMLGDQPVTAGGVVVAQARLELDTAIGKDPFGDESECRRALSPRPRRQLRFRLSLAVSGAGFPRAGARLRRDAAATGRRPSRRPPSPSRCTSRRARRWDSERRGRSG